MDDVYEILYEVMVESRWLAEDISGKAIESFKRNDDVRFQKNVMIRPEVFPNDDMAKAADMSTPEGIEFMSYVARAVSIFGGE